MAVMTQTPGPSTLPSVVARAAAVDAAAVIRFELPVDVRITAVFVAPELAREAPAKIDAALGS